MGRSGKWLKKCRKSRKFTWIKGYNPINQIVGYVLSGDPAYVPRYNNARNQIRKYERDEIVEELVRYYLKGQGIDL